MDILGIDVGASGIKGAVVDIKKGGLVTLRHRIPTPHPATPKAVANAIHEAQKMVKTQVNEHIRHELEMLRGLEVVSENA